MDQKIDQITKQLDCELSVEEFVRSIKVREGQPNTVFLGAGASISSGIPSAKDCTWEWKREIFQSFNPNMEDIFQELSVQSVKDRLQKWFDEQVGYPSADAYEEYGFYIEKCYSEPVDRQEYFKKKIIEAKPYVGYHLLCKLAKAGLVQSVWSTNFDGLTSQTAKDYEMIPYEVGIDSQNRLNRQLSRDELLVVSLHGDYRYDQIMNTDRELQSLQASFYEELQNRLIETPLIVIGYSGRDKSVMDALYKIYSKRCKGGLYWCGYSNDPPSKSVVKLLQTAKDAGNRVHYIPTDGFDDLMVRLAKGCLDRKQQDSVKEIITRLAPNSPLERGEFKISRTSNYNIIKSNAFELRCPDSIYNFEVKDLPEKDTWQFLDRVVVNRDLVVAPFKGKLLAIGVLEDIKSVFGKDIVGDIEHYPIEFYDLKFENGIIVNLLRRALVNSIAKTINFPTDGIRELWKNKPFERHFDQDKQYQLHKSAKISIKTINKRLHMIIEPSIKAFDESGKPVSIETASAINRDKLGNQYNNVYNREVNEWRNHILFNRNSIKNQRIVSFEYPVDCDSHIKFKVHKPPSFGVIYQRENNRTDKSARIKEYFLKSEGVEIAEPRLLFSSKEGSTKVSNINSVTGIKNNRPFDFPLTQTGIISEVRVGVICPKNNAKEVWNYLQKLYKNQRADDSELDHLYDYEGFQKTFGIHINIPEPDTAGWYSCPEPKGNTDFEIVQENVNIITQGIESLQATVSPHVILIYFPEHWHKYQYFQTEDLQIDVHDQVKAYAVQKGVSTQLLRYTTLVKEQLCSILWWLSLALYVKARRTPWILNELDDDTIYTGIGFSVNYSKDRENHIMLGCSHIYNPRGEGLQFRVNKIKNIIFRQRNPFMSKEDARLMGESIRQLFYERSHKLPKRVVIHKRTPFLFEEREGLSEGLAGVPNIDMIEIQWCNALRYIAQKSGKENTPVADGFPIKRGTLLLQGNHEALLWVHGVVPALNNPRYKYFMGKRRIPTPLVLRNHAGNTPVTQIASEILGFSKMNWNSFDLYSKLPATIESSNRIAKIGQQIQDMNVNSYDYRLFF